MIRLFGYLKCFGLLISLLKVGVCVVAESIDLHLEIVETLTKRPTTASRATRTVVPLLVAQVFEHFHATISVVDLIFK